MFDKEITNVREIWNSSLEANATKLQAVLISGVGFQPTWTASAVSDMGESLPITGLDWYDAEAFCIWDGGRLPTEAEWNYAASGGTEQRVYPWGSAAPDATYAVYDVTAAAPVGSTSPKGDGKWGQADLAGNVFEWVQDWYVSPYANPCTNCAEAGSSGYKVTRGGGLGSDASVLVSSYRIETGPSSHSTSLGARCARSAP